MHREYPKILPVMFVSIARCIAGPFLCQDKENGGKVIAHAVRKFFNRMSTPVVVPASRKFNDARLVEATFAAY